jgi:hypothetical protein
MDINKLRDQAALAILPRLLEKCRGLDNDEEAAIQKAWKLADQFIFAKLSNKPYWEKLREEIDKANWEKQMAEEARAKGQHDTTIPTTASNAL